jgi:hypothetical protein
VRVRPELRANLVKLVSSCCAASTAGGCYGCTCFVGLCCTGCAWRDFGLVFGRARSGGSVVSWVVVRYVVAMIRQSNAAWLWVACCEHWLGRVALCVPEDVVMKKYPEAYGKSTTRGTDEAS